ncbi:hypothetical protein ACI79G_16010 [Geodermatophilus sp. SYSU D00779]
MYLPGDIVVVLPGITGSVLQKDGRDVFALSLGAGLRGLLSRGGSVRALRLAEDPVDRDELDDGVRAVRVARDTHLLPGLWKIDGYSRLTDLLVGRLRLQGEVDVREFPYDWRRDNRVAARRLQQRAAEWLIERRREHPDARLVLVAHSMGGLVSRYYLEVLGGWRDTRALITFGTPFRGSLNALDFLAHGFRKLGGLVDLTETLRSMTSVYQLLPIYPCLDEGDGELRRLTELTAPVPGLDPDQVRRARAFHREIEEAVTRNRDDDEYRCDGYRLARVIGAEHPTGQSARRRGDSLELLRTYRGEELLGDGTVPRVSASPQELDSDEGAVFSGTRHASLQNADAVLTQLRGWFTGRKLDGFLAGAPVTVSVDLEDAYLPDEPLVVRVRPAEPGTDLQVTLNRLPTDRAAAPHEVTVNAETVEDWTDVTLPPQEPGCYRITVGGGAEVEPVQDVVLVSGGAAAMSDRVAPT